MLKMLHNALLFRLSFSEYKTTFGFTAPGNPTAAPELLLLTTVEAEEDLSFFSFVRFIE